MQFSSPMNVVLIGARANHNSALPINNSNCKGMGNHSNFEQKRCQRVRKAFRSQDKSGPPVIIVMNDHDLADRLTHGDDREISMDLPWMISVVTRLMFPIPAATMDTL